MRDLCMGRLDPGLNGYDCQLYVDQHDRRYCLHKDDCTMRHKYPLEPYIGQRWTSVDYKEFEILDLTALEDDAWVTYRNTATGQEYSCRLEAFRHRFTAQLD